MSHNPESDVVVDEYEMISVEVMLQGLQQAVADPGLASSASVGSEGGWVV